jgi:hypothetical protein
MNNCRKTELFPKDEEISIEDSNTDSSKKNDTKDVSNIIKTHSQSDDIIEKIDINLIKIVEDIVNRILVKKVPNKILKSNKAVVRKPIKVSSKRKIKDTGLAPKKLKSWIYLGK